MGVHPLGIAGRGDPRWWGQSRPALAVVPPNTGQPSWCSAGRLVSRFVSRLGCRSCRCSPDRTIVRLGVVGCNRGDEGTNLLLGLGRWYAVSFVAGSVYRGRIVDRWWWRCGSDGHPPGVLAVLHDVDVRVVLRQEEEILRVESGRVFRDRGGVGAAESEVDFTA